MKDPSPPRLPVYQEFMNPVLDVLRQHGPLLIEELVRRVGQAMALSDDVIQAPHGGRSNQSEMDYRIAWARSYLKKFGLLENPARGLWGVTEAGRASGTVDPAEVVATVQKAYAEEVARDDDEDERQDSPFLEGPPLWASPTLRDELQTIRAAMVTEGALLSAAEVNRFLATFRERFGPETLAVLDGEALLQRMHGRTTKDSLVYWLEFKEDDDFLTTRFGSIAGGSAFKFDLYQTAQGNAWMGGSGKQPRPLTLEEAIEKARTQRKQFIAGDGVLRAWASRPEVDYPALQRELVEAAPDVAEKSWGHKYFSLLYPELLDHNHGEDYQRFQVIKLLTVPAKGRYENAKPLVEAARALGMSLVELSSVLFRRNGGSHAYWRVGTTIDDTSEWTRMREGEFMAVGWDELGDLSLLPEGAEARDAIRAGMAQHYPRAASIVSRRANEIFHFLLTARPRDVVVAMEGTTVLGVGLITGPYSFTAGDSAAHRRPVKWLSVQEWRLPITEGIRTVFTRLGKKPENLVAIERVLADRPHPSSPAEPAATVKNDETSKRPATPPSLTGVAARIQATLQRKRQVILYGPPGTGKTFWAERTVEELAARSWFHRDAQSLNEEQRASLRQQGAIEVCSFHSAYGYEDFLEGFRPEAAGGQLHFALRDGVFKRLCSRARLAPDQAFFLVIDEINRGDIPRILGELLTVLEKDKRNRQITLPLSGEAFSVPDNVFVVGTMNTADRSIALLDAALRRRFGFIELLPDSSTLGLTAVAGLPLGPWLDELNRRILQNMGRDGRSLQVGHSYLLGATGPIRDLARFAEVLRDDILPLLEEYCYEDFERLERILGSGIVKRDQRRFDERLFAPERQDELIQILMAAFPDIAVTDAAVRADAQEENFEDDEAQEEAA